jgi:hypothetical protein
VKCNFLIGYSSPYQGTIIALHPAPLQGDVFSVLRCEVNWITLFQRLSTTHHPPCSPTPSSVNSTPHTKCAHCAHSLKENVLGGGVKREKLFGADGPVVRLQTKRKGREDFYVLRLRGALFGDGYPMKTAYRQCSRLLNQVYARTWHHVWYVL